MDNSIKNSEFNILNWHRMNIIFLIPCPMRYYYEELKHQIRKISTKSHWSDKISIEVYHKLYKWRRNDGAESPKNIS